MASFRPANRAAFEAAFLQVLLLGNESRLLRLGMVAIGGIKIDAKAPRNGRCAKAARRNCVPKLAAADRRSAKGRTVLCSARPARRMKLSRSRSWYSVRSSGDHRSASATA